MIPVINTVQSGTFKFLHNDPKLYNNRDPANFVTVLDDEIEYIESGAIIIFVNYEWAVDSQVTKFEAEIELDGVVRNIHNKYGIWVDEDHDFMRVVLHAHPAPGPMPIKIRFKPATAAANTSLTDLIVIGFQDS